MISLIVFYAGIIIILFSVITVLKHAFGRGLLWPVFIILFLPLTVVYIGLNWKELSMRKALYISIAGLLAIAVGIFGGALARVPFLPKLPIVETLKETTAPELEPLPNEKEAEAIELGDRRYDPVLTGSQFEEPDLKPLAPDTDKTVNQLKTVERKWRPIEKALLPYLSNKEIQLHMQNGQTPVGVIHSVSENSLVLGQLAEGGAVEFTYPYADIVSVEALLSNAELVQAQQQDAAQNAIQVEAKEADDTKLDLEEVTVVPEKRLLSPNTEVTEETPASLEPVPESEVNQGEQETLQESVEP